MLGGSPHAQRPLVRRLIVASLLLTWTGLFGTAAIAADPVVAVVAVDSDPAEQARKAGRTIFLEGRNRHGEAIQARVGSGLALQGDAVACARCHGPEGAGNREGGLTAPALDWNSLSQARSASPGLLPRSRYDDVAVLRALRQGVDVEGRPLSTAMPRFTLAPREEADLLTYLRSLGQSLDIDPGLTPDRVVLGGVLPLSGPLAAAGQAADAAIRSCVAQANREGGIHGRQLAWQALDAHKLAPTEIARQLREQSFAVVAPWWGDLGSQDLVERLAGVPLIGPLGAATELDQPQPTLFAVAPQLSQQVRNLVDAVALGELAEQVSVHRPDNVRLSVIASPAAHHRAALVSSQRQAQNHPNLTLSIWQPKLGLSDAGQLADALRWLAAQPRQDAVLVLGPSNWMRSVTQSGRGRQPLAEADKSPSGSAQGPLILGAFAEQGQAVLDWPASLRDRLRLSHTVPEDAPLDPGPLRQALASVDASLSHPAVQSLAHAAACLTIDGLKRAGRDPSRARLRVALESVRDFRTGVVGPLNYSRQSHLGTVGSAIVRISADGRRLETVREWRTPQSW
ncbi:ABC transporter substrate-binding protein [Sphaerotilus mobilis]|uniref:Amino acid/amide ABC transporter substrate-binding protein (HAAT family) n=1 Tax=Sphaerotilus mobilis TaxID=47994 RepID=A0A4Q7LUV2_9BURK|nr:ABC transporter substrate-binding protein [Sphaerotilus mobilis]RZS58027.1 amino acid/amide ABC transporter substrate-binding protein (HAAT family) [Sphaerotilus mobilis]